MGMSIRVVIILLVIFLSISLLGGTYLILGEGITPFQNILFLGLGINLIFGAIVLAFVDTRR